MDKKEYERYLKSKKWQRIRKKKLARVPTCEMARIDVRYLPSGRPLCVCSGPLQVHHLNYDRVGGDELMSDLMVLCEFHHKEVHEHQKAIDRQNKKNRALNTYATKKYGDDWLEWKDVDEIRFEFNRWLRYKRGY